MTVYSKEYIFRECSLHNHCLEVVLKDNILWGDESVNVIYVTELLLTEKDRETLSQNWANGVNTFGRIVAKAFISSSPSAYDTNTVQIDTNNIESIWKRS